MEPQLCLWRAGQEEQHPNHSEPSGSLLAALLRSLHANPALPGPVSVPAVGLGGRMPTLSSLPRLQPCGAAAAARTKSWTSNISASATDSQGTQEQPEFMDPPRQYSTRLAALSSSLTGWRKLPALPAITSQLHHALAGEPIPVSRVAACVCSALSHIRADTKEELVVQSRIP
uniref:Uncharacterized protein n=1 Tax=Oryctolagus cuniculus TaxID=9986 RepID=A0A5F9D7L8_RABIT